MKKRERSWTKQIMGIVSAFGLTFAMACASTTDTHESSHDAQSDEVAVGKATDPIGPPQHIATRPLTDEHPSSNTGYGNADSSGANTNLNRPAPKSTTTVTEPKVVVTQTPIEEEAVVVTKTEPVVEKKTETVETRRMTRKE